MPLNEENYDLDLVALILKIIESVMISRVLFVKGVTIEG